MWATSHSSTWEAPPRISPPRTRSGINASSLACIASASSHELVAIPRPVSRSTTSDIPTHPSRAVIVGITSSRMNAIPASIDSGSPLMRG